MPARHWELAGTSSNMVQDRTEETPLSHENLVHTTDERFEADVLKSELPVLVDFWAEWCGPCKMIAPALDQAAQSYAGKLRIAKLDVDENGATAAKFNIRGIPALLLFKDGQVVGQRVGAVSK